MIASPVYEIHSSVFSKDGGLFVVSALLTVGSLLAYDEPLLMAAGLALFGAGTFILGRPLITRAVELRIDAAGVNVGGPTLPWLEITGLSACRVGRFGLRTDLHVARGDLMTYMAEPCGGEEPGVNLERFDTFTLTFESWRFNRAAFQAAAAHYARWRSSTAPQVSEAGIVFGGRTFPWAGLVGLAVTLGVQLSDVVEVSLSYGRTRPYEPDDFHHPDDYDESEPGEVIVVERWHILRVAAERFDEGEFRRELARYAPQFG